MILPIHDSRSRHAHLGAAAFRAKSPFRGRTTAAADQFAGLAQDQRARIKSEDTTPRLAREVLRARLVDVGQRLRAEASAFTTIPANFAALVRESAATRAAARKLVNPLEALLAENNRLLRASLAEQQLVSRAAEFAEAGKLGHQPATASDMLRFYQLAKARGDDAAVLHASRRLAVLKSTVSPDEQLTIEQATTDPSEVNPALVSHYLGQLEGAQPVTRHGFVETAIQHSDASMLVAAFHAAQFEARATPQGEAVPAWVYRIANVATLGAVPESVVNQLVADHVVIAANDVQAAMTDVDAMVDALAHEASLADLEQAPVLAPFPTGGLPIASE